MAAGEPRCARAVIEYDGTAFAGSQYQPNARTVQGELEEALNRLTGERVRVRFAGRTDAGVHATGQVIAFCLSGERVAWRELQRRLNAVLPDDVAVRGMRATPRGFDPRRAAVARVYRYRIRMGGVAKPLERHRTLEISDRLDVAAMRVAAASITGERDYAALGSDTYGRTVRHLSEVAVLRRGAVVEIRVTGDAFLRRMVRSIAAILLEVGRGKLAPGDVPGLLDAPSRALHGRAAPAHGLTLEKVIYSNTEPSQRQRRTPGRAPSVQAEAKKREP
jgi:tRNA pseudouridine38-40 synthase